jgi:hypothetical protein
LEKEVAGSPEAKARQPILSTNCNFFQNEVQADIF